MVGWLLSSFNYRLGVEKEANRSSSRLRVLHASVTISEIVCARKEFDYGLSELTFKFSRGTSFLFSTRYPIEETFFRAGRISSEVGEKEEGSASRLVEAVNSGLNKFIQQIG